MQYSHRIWGQEEGLFQPTVYSILQTRDGVLWLGTQDSLLRFDGLHFREFDDSPEAPLHRSLVRDLAEDDDGNLWAASVGSGLLRIAANRSHSLHRENGLPSNDVFCVDAHSSRDVWACTNRGLVHFSGRDFRTYSTAEGLPTNAIRNTCLSTDGTRWVAGLDFGLARMNGERYEAYQNSSLPLSNGVTALRCSQDGAVWAGTDAGVVRISQAGSRVISTKDGLPDNDVLSLYQGADGTMWIGTTGGVSRWYKGEVSAYRTRDGLSHSSVLSLFEDREGTLWAGTKNGLDQFADGKVTPYTRHEGLSSDDIGPVLEDHEHHLWIGTLSHGLNLYDGSRFRTFTKANGLSDNSILSLELDGSGDLWIGTKHGLNLWHRDSVVATFDRANGLSGNEVRAIFSDGQGVLWVGTEGGLDRWDGHRFVRSDGILSKDPLGSIVAIGSGRLSRLLVSTEQGIYALRNGTASHTSADLARPADCYFLDRRRGETWMGTLGSGLLRYRNGAVTHVRVKDGLYDNRIYSIVQDDQANLWFASSKGIFRVAQRQLDDFADGKTAAVTSLPFTTGQLRFECQSGVQPAATRTRDGRLWFATNNGLVMIDPGNLGKNTVAPPVSLTGLLVNGRRVTPDPARQLQLSPLERNIEVRYAGFSFISPERVGFRYMLKGYEKTWTDAGSRREAFFTNLPPGAFEFQVSARNADGVWSAKPASLRFYVTPRLYERIWFFPILVVVLGLFVGVIYRMRISRMRQTFSIVLSERTRIARELHDTLLQGISGITMQLQALWTSMPPSKERASLADIIADAGRCSKDARRSLWGLRNLGGHAESFSERLTKVAQDTVGTSCNLLLQVQSTSLSHHPDLEFQLLRIASEAISNSLQSRVRDDNLSYSCLSMENCGLRSRTTVLAFRARRTAIWALWFSRNARTRRRVRCRSQDS